MNSKRQRVNRTQRATQANRATQARQAPTIQAAEANQQALQRATAEPLRATAGDIAALQSAYGNRAVSGLLRSAAIQAKLIIGAAGDQYEQEADSVAERVINMPAPGAPLPTSTGMGKGTPSAQRQEGEEATTGPTSVVQRRESGSFEASQGLETRLAAKKGGGSPLPAAVRSFMEPRFGADFGSVRVHTGSEAAQMTREIGAQAFTHGSNIYFSPNKYSPGTESGRLLLAHELTHTLQQGASSHIRGWWPKGHRLVTEMALTKGGFDKLYNEEARKYLVDRSPDVDFIQDEFETMNEGIKQSKSRLSMYEHLITSGQASEARKMYNNNDLHMRRPAYMMSHGEGGRYKIANASAINEAMTTLMVEKAAGMWQWNDYTSWGKSLSVLSDALHQAEDRGSHGEGNAFTGHDVRIKMNKSPWEKEGVKLFQAKSGMSPSEWDPDNISVNKKGAVLAVGFAQRTLAQFVHAIGASANRPIELTAGKHLPSKRKLKAKSWLPKGTSSGAGVHFVGSTGGGMDTLKKVFEETKPTMEEAYGSAKAGHTQEELLKQLSGEDAALLLEGLSFYERGAGLPESDTGPGEQEQQVEEVAVMTQVYLAALAQFKAWGKSRLRGGKSTKERIRLAKSYYQTQTSGYKDREQKARQAAIKAAYQAAFGERLSV
jgi:hypothetical protein